MTDIIAAVCCLGSLFGCYRLLGRIARRPRTHAVYNFATIRLEVGTIYKIEAGPWKCNGMLLRRIDGRPKTSTPPMHGCTLPGSWEFPGYEVEALFESKNIVSQYLTIQGEV